ncbi:MAG: DUF4440 domain-containing protein [Acidobacteriaceae bacterium]
MKNVIRVYCTLFLLTTSAAFSQATPDATSQNAGSAATPAMANMSDPATETSLQKMETELSQAAAAHDTAPFTKYLDDNIVALGPGWKASSKAEVLAGLKSDPCTVSNPAVSGFSYKWLSPDLVLVSYMENYTSACKGKTTPGAEHDNSLWQRKNGQWVSVFHQATADLPSTTTGGN